MPMVEISFDTYKQLTMLRGDESVTYDDVIRKLMKLPPVTAQSFTPAKKSWTYKNVTLPDATDLRANYKGETYTAKINDGAWIQNGQIMNSPSEAATAITKTSVNGWTFWEARLPGDTRWRMIKSMR
jgi:Restriction Enzyme Adenine Methylase Associated